MRVCASRAIRGGKYWRSLMRINFKTAAFPQSGTLYIPTEHLASGPAIPQGMEEDVKKSFQRALKNSHFSAKKGEILSFPGPSSTDYDRIAFFGLGEKDKIKAQDLIEVGAHIVADARKYKEEEVFVALGGLCTSELSNAKVGSLMGLGANLRQYNFHKYRTQLKDRNKLFLKDVSLGVDSCAEAEALYQQEFALAEGIHLARDLMAETPNVLYPKTFADIAKGLETLGVKVQVLSEKDMEKLGMDALLGVGLGSEKESFMVVMEWNGGAKGEAPVALVGKGVTFDSGGISIKPSSKMDEMKMDMTGAAIVTGVMKALALRKARTNVVGVIGLVENMPDGKAQRPADVVKTMSGQTIEILNTDAEGRLLLADVLYYTQERFKPKVMVNFATLTGAIYVALGSKFAGLFSNNDALAKQLSDSGEETREYVWRLPLDERYDKDIDSKIADVKNVGGKGAGSITAAQFLQRFVNKTPWAHLDIAGTAIRDEPSVLGGDIHEPYGLRLIHDFVKKFHEVH